MKNLHCSLFGHQFEVSRHITNAVKEFKCKHCKKQATINGKGELTLLTPKYKKINSVLENIHLRRQKRKQESLILNR